MKTFKQLMEDLTKPVTPKQFDVKKSDTMFIRTPDIIKKENIKFRNTCLLYSNEPVSLTQSINGIESS